MENNFNKENEQLEAGIEPNEVAEVKTEAAPENEEIVSDAPAVKKPFPAWILGVLGVLLAAVITLIVLVVPKQVDYTVTVVDEIGNPVSNVMVKLTDASGETKTRVTDKSGKVVFGEVKVRKIGEANIVKLDKGLSDAKILTAQYQLDKKTTELRAVVCNESNILNIFGEIPDDSYAYVVKSGNYSIPSLTGTVYLNFNANTRGIYKVSINSDDADAEVAYVGNPYFVQTVHIGDGEYDGKSFELVIQSVDTPYVIAVNSAYGADIDLTIERTGNAPFDANYDVPTKNITMQMKDLPTVTFGPDKEFKDFDVTDSNLTVELRDDGYYYTSDGKLIYLRLASVGDYSRYIDKPIASIYDMVGMGGYQMGGVGGSNFGGFVFDENGNYIEKRIYNDMLESYYELANSKAGVYPLTAELAEAIKVHGENAGWFDASNQNTYLFSTSIVAENAWLFLCCTEN